MEMGKISKNKFSGTLMEGVLQLTDCPQSVDVIGDIPPRQGLRFVTVVGSRNPSPYARQALEHIMRGLLGQSVCIVSGLALGIDALAHRTALAHGLSTVAFPGSGLESVVLYPASNRNLAGEIVEQGGCLISEFKSDQAAMQWTFPKRNRLMAAVADLVLVVEAGEKSGTLITARNASEYGVDVAVIPGSIFNQGAVGSNDLIKQGAHIVTTADDILNLLGISKIDSGEKNYDDCGNDEQTVLDLLVEPHSRDSLATLSGFDAVQLSTTLSLLEIKGHVKEELGLIYKI